MREENISLHSFVARVRASSSAVVVARARGSSRAWGAHLIANAVARIFFWVFRACAVSTTTTTCGDAIAIARDVMMVCAHISIIVARARDAPRVVGGVARRGWIRINSNPPPTPSWGFTCENPRGGRRALDVLEMARVARGVCGRG